MGSTAAHGKTRPTIVDGIFYPAERGQLRTLVGSLLDGSPVTPGSCLGCISPHAGYSYAGSVMAAAFRAISARTVRTVILLGPVHRDPAEGVFLPESEVFSTPLGPLPVDTEAVKELQGRAPIFSVSDVPHLEEHCLEVQLPFLAALFPQASIVPILVGRVGTKAVEALAESLRLTFQSRDEYTACVISANMASYMKGTDTPAESEKIMAMIEKADWRSIASASGKSGMSSCGTACIAAGLLLAGGSARVQRLARADSRGVDGDTKRTVHYAAFGITRN